MDLFFICLIFSLVFGSSSVPLPSHPDKVIHLPGAPFHPRFNLFSGYLNGSSNNDEVPMFYVLAEAIRVNPSTAPLVVWFNGGPGGSSLYGFFLGPGPYRLTDDPNNLKFNEFSWNQYANVLFLESPLGVGFSQNDEGRFTSNDNDAAECNFNAITDFMTRVHPRYADRDYYLTGQSYAGVYIPFLVRRLLVERKFGRVEKGKFKGFAIGNPTFNHETSTLAEAMQFLNFGLVPQRQTELVLNSWSKHQKGEKVERYVLHQIRSIINDDIPDNYVDWDSPINYNFNEHCYAQPSKHSEEEYHWPTEKNSIACNGKKTLEIYLNREDVQRSLHVGHSFEEKTWHVVNPKFRRFNRNYDVLPVYEEIIRLANDSSLRILIYNGVVDTVMPPLHAIHCTTKIARDNLMAEEKYEKDWKFFNDFAGTRTGYWIGDVSMDVLSVRGAGHNVPMDLPAQAFQIINNFIFTDDLDAVNYSRPIRKH